MVWGKGFPAHLKNEYWQIAVQHLSDAKFNGQEFWTLSIFSQTGCHSKYVNLQCSKKILDQIKIRICLPIFHISKIYIWEFNQSYTDIFPYINV